MEPERRRQVELVYHAARECEPAKRDSFLQQACAGDEILRSEVESLLGYEGRAEGFLDASAREVAGQALTSGRARSMIGSTLGRYQILSLLGAGGMGEVYRARDTRLDREVALKILPPDLTTDATMVARFEREAKAIAALSHPNILAIHDFGIENGVSYAVMELLEGENLRSRLARSALSWQQAVEIAIALADGLSAAHAKSITHRDLKPGNIMLTKSGVKILDFGLAKVDSTACVASETKETLTLTREGAVIGTVQYMAPEQLQGKQTDSRSDIFAFGVVVYEMITGRKAFEGAHPASVAAAILHTDPQPPATLQPRMPMALDRVIRKCLAKDPEDRWQTARDLKDELQWIGEGMLQSEPAGPGSNKKHFPWMLSAVVAVLVLALAGLAIYVVRKPVQMPSTRFLVPPPENSIMALVNVGGPVAISPDGRQLTFVASGLDGNNYLWVQALDSVSARMLQGTSDASYPFWSPDSRLVSFFAEGKLKKIALSGGPPQVLCDAPSGRGGSWSRDNIILFSPHPVSGLYRIAAAGGEAIAVTTRDLAANESGHTWPQFFPDGRKFLHYVSTGKQESSGIYSGSLDSKERRHLLSANSNAAYAAPTGAEPGYLLFARGTTLIAQPFDHEKLRLSGESVSVAENLGYYEGFRIGDFSVSQNGVLAYGSGIVYPLSQLIWFDRGGKQLESVGTAAHQVAPRLAPDEQWIAMARMDLRTAAKVVWLMEVAGDRSSRFTFDPYSADFPVWSPDGSRIVFGTARDGAFNLYQKRAAGGNEEPLLRSDEFKLPTDWSPDGTSILFQSRSVIKTNPNWDLWILPLSQDRKPYPLIQSRFNESAGRFSPDGRLVAYVSDESGRPEICIRRSREPSSSDEKWQISTNGGTDPRWRRDGRELFYIGADQKLTSVEIKTMSNTVVAGVPKPLFQASSSYDVAADGQRFLVNVRVGGSVTSPITVALNWSQTLKR
jgi:eukaryotic-like serine/threonine-protein kinase